MSFPQQNNKLKNYIIAPQFYVHENRLLRQPPSVLTSLVNQVYGALIDPGVPVSADSQFPLAQRKLAAVVHHPESE
jgi:hypothetical protein